MSKRSKEQLVSDMKRFTEELVGALAQARGKLTLPQAAKLERRTREALAGMKTTREALMDIIGWDGRRTGDPHRRDRRGGLPGLVSRGVGRLGVSSGPRLPFCKELQMANLMFVHEYRQNGTNPLTMAERVEAVVRCEKGENPAVVLPELYRRHGATYTKKANWQALSATVRWIKCEVASGNQVVIDLVREHGGAGLLQEAKA